MLYIGSIMETANDPHQDTNKPSVIGPDHAVLLRKSWVRYNPRNRGGRAVKLNEGTTVALRKNCGLWWQIEYRNPVTERLECGWIYGSLIEKVGWSPHSGDSQDNHQRDN
jgi:hypothetical protein